MNTLKTQTLLVKRTNTIAKLVMKRALDHKYCNVILRVVISPEPVDPIRSSPAVDDSGESSDAAVMLSPAVSAASRPGRPSTRRSPPRSLVVNEERQICILPTAPCVRSQPFKY